MDFAWLVFMGMQFGYREIEVGHMYLRKWVELFDVYKRIHNMKMNRGMYKTEPEKVSLLDI